MRWILGKLVGAVVAGVGWKLGADAYEAVKKHIKERSGNGEEEEGAAATQTHSVDVDTNKGARR